MSTGAIAPNPGVPEGELAISQRVQQLQRLIEQTRQVGSGVLPTSTTSAAFSAASAPGSPSATAPQAPAGDFAAALQAATTADYASPTAVQSESAAGAEH